MNDLRDKGKSGARTITEECSTIELPHCPYSPYRIYFDLRMDLFTNSSKSKGEPLASRMRPRTLDEYAGQDHIIGPGRLLRRAIQLDQLSSIILYGPPGTGKTTLARVIANTTKRHFMTINAVLSGVKEIREAIDKARELMDLYDQKTILFVDEVHRWNKSQQDALLPWVENGTFILIGATIENPFFEVNRALVSRSRIFQLVPLGDRDLYRIAEQAIRDPERGYGAWNVTFDDEALDHIVRVANGDARSLLGAIELAVETTPDSFPPRPGSVIRITLEAAEESIQKKAVLYDKDGDYHFDTASVFIKSLRGSDPDAALYWLAKMTAAGEDPRFIFRRMLILASEDVGLADPNAIVVVNALASAFERVGLPEGRFHLTEAALYLSTCPKSNSALGFFDALKSVEAEKDADVPDPFKDSSRDKTALGHGDGYLYPHAYKDHWVAQAYLPESLAGRIFYKPTSMGYEAGIRDIVTARREAQLEAVFESVSGMALTYGETPARIDEWYSRTVESDSGVNADLRGRIFRNTSLARYSRVFDVNAGSGLLVWEALRRVPEGSVYCLVESEESKRIIENYSSILPDPERPVLLTGTLALFDPANHPELEKSLRFDAIIGRNPFTGIGSREACFTMLIALLSEGGELSIAQILPSMGTRLSALADASRLEGRGIDVSVLRASEEEMYSSETNPAYGFDGRTLELECANAGFKNAHAEIVEYENERLVTGKDLSRWFNLDGGTGPTYGKLLVKRFTEAQVKLIRQSFTEQLENRKVPWKRSFAFVSGKK